MREEEEEEVIEVVIDDDIYSFIDIDNIPSNREGPS
jgi:hypothetical protein